MLHGPCLGIYVHSDRNDWRIYLSFVFKLGYDALYFLQISDTSSAVTESGQYILQEFEISLMLDQLTFNPYLNFNSSLQKSIF